LGVGLGGGGGGGGFWVSGGVWGVVCLVGGVLGGGGVGCGWGGGGGGSPQVFYTG